MANEVECDGRPAVTADDVKAAKGRGFLHNKGTNTFSARVVTACGRVTAAQTRALADLAERFGNGEVTLTTRLSFEIPGIAFESIDAFAECVSEIGLAVGGTGPRVRPVVACKGTVCPRGLIDTFSLARRIHERFYVGWHGVKLPGKFKIAVGGCPNNCVKPDLNDIGIVGCVRAGGARGYRVTLGGHWGRTGGAGREVATFGSEDETLAFVEKALAFYRDNGLEGERFFKTLARLQPQWT